MYLLNYWLELSILAKVWSLMPAFLLVAAKFFAFRCKQSQVLYHYTKDISDLKCIDEEKKIEGRTQGRVFASHVDTSILGDFKFNVTPGKIIFTKESVNLFRPISSHSNPLISFLSPWDNIKMLTQQWVTREKGDLRIDCSMTSDGEMVVTSSERIPHSKPVKLLSNFRSIGVFFINLILICIFEIQIMLYLLTENKLNPYYWIVLPLTLFIVVAIAFYKCQRKLNSFARNWPIQ